MPVYLTLEEASERLGVEYRTVYRLVRSGELPAGKIGRIYRISEADLEAFFEKQKRLVSEQAQRDAGPGGALVCAACGKASLSQLSIGGLCSVTGQPICQACWSIKRIRRVSEATLQQGAEATQSSESRPESGGSVRQSTADVSEQVRKLRSRGQFVITAEEAAAGEAHFLRMFGQRLENVELLPDPISGRSIVLAQARVKHTIDADDAHGPHQPANRISRFELKTGGWGKPKSGLVVQAMHLSRIERLRSQGYDSAPLDARELTPVLEAVAVDAAASKLFTFALIGSPTGWAQTVSTMPPADAASDDSGQPMCAVALADLRSDALLFDHADPRLAGLRAILEPRAFAAEVTAAAEAIRTALASRDHLTLTDAATLCNCDRHVVEAAFCVLAKQDALACEGLGDLDCVIVRREA